MRLTHRQWLSGRHDSGHTGQRVVTRVSHVTRLLAFGALLGAAPRGATAAPSESPDGPEDPGSSERSAPMVVASAPEPAADGDARTTDELLTMAEVEQEADVEPEEEIDWPCVVIPHPGCGTQAHVEAGMGWGESSSYVGTQFSWRGFFEGGVLFAVHEDLQLGPVAELGFDAGSVNSGYTLTTKARFRYWMGGWYISLDGAAGAAFEHFTFDGGTENGTREGVVAELGLSVLGVLGPYVACYALRDFGGLGSHEERWLVGFRGSVTSWFLGMGAAAGSSGPILIW